MNERTVQIILFVLGGLCLIAGVILITTNHGLCGGAFVFAGTLLILIGAIGPSTVKNFKMGWGKDGFYCSFGRYKYSEKKLKTVHKYVEVSANPIAEISTNPKELPGKIELPEKTEFSFKRREASPEESKILKKAAQELPPAEIKIKAEKLIEAAEKRKEGERAPEDYLALALKAWKDKNFDEGLGLAYSGLNLNPKNKKTQAGLYNALGLIYPNFKSYELSEENYKKAIEIDEKAYWLHNNLGTVYYHQKKYNDAERAYKEALRLKPDYFYAYNNLGIIYAEQKKYALAETEFNETLKLNPNSLNAHSNLGFLYYLQGDYQKAEKKFKECLHLNPDDADTYNTLGLLYFDLKRWEEASDHFGQALSHDQSSSESIAGKAITLLRLGKDDEALALFRKAVSLDPEFKDPKVLQEKYSWSDQACEAAWELIERL